MRTVSQQNGLYATGRKPLSEVNTLRKRAGLPTVTELENQKPVTYAKGGESWHNLGTAKLMAAGGAALYEVHGNAVDIVDQRYGWEAPDKFWDALGSSALKYGCEWGGNWPGKKKDVAHVQMMFVETGPLTTVAV